MDQVSAKFVKIEAGTTNFISRMKATVIFMGL